MALTYAQAAASRDPTPDLSDSENWEGLLDGLASDVDVTHQGTAGGVQLPPLPEKKKREFSCIHCHIIFYY